MPATPLPEGDSSLSGGDSPVSDATDVLAEFPGPHRQPSVAPVRDAFAAAWAEGFKVYQLIAARAAALCDPLRATGDYLKSFAHDFSVIPGLSESEPSVRARLFAAPDIVSPDALCSAVDGLLAAHTTATCRISELELDGYFVHDGTAEWDSYIGTDPDYPDRYYEDDPSMLPGGAVPSSAYPRNFLLRIPPLESSDETISYAISLDDDGLFVEDGSGDGEVALSLFVDPQRADDVYAAIIGLVETIKGHGISWSLLVDPSLTD